MGFTERATPTTHLSEQAGDAKIGHHPIKPVGEGLPDRTRHNDALEEEFALAKTMSRRAPMEVLHKSSWPSAWRRLKRRSVKGVTRRFLQNRTLSCLGQERSANVA